MIQKALILTLILTFNSLYSQSGQVFYEAISKKHPETKENKADAYIAELENTKILLELKFNTSFSYFKKSHLNKSDDFNFGEEALTILIGFEELYYNSKDKSIYLDSGEVLIKKEANHNWEILSESKMIDNYLCYKASCVEKYTSRNGKNKERTITAWFCPEIPYSFGPLEYNGLPGLILELEKNGNKVVAKSILLSEKTIELKIPNKKIITKEEYDKKIKENSQF